MEARDQLRVPAALSPTKEPPDQWLGIWVCLKVGLDAMV
jgi:hypothetical protein